MDYTTASLLCAALMLFLLLIGVPIAYSLGFSSILVGYFAFGGFALQKAGWTTFQLLYNLTWTPLPLFTLMSFLIAETQILAFLTTCCQKKSDNRLIKHPLDHPLILREILTNNRKIKAAKNAGITFPVEKKSE